jgi:hypothetical protein
VRSASDDQRAAAAVVEVARSDLGGVRAVVVRTIDVVPRAGGVGTLGGHVVGRALGSIERAVAVLGSPAAVVFRVPGVVGHEGPVGRRARDDVSRASAVVRRASAVVGGAFAVVGGAFAGVWAESAVVDDGWPVSGSVTAVIGGRSAMRSHGRLAGTSLCSSFDHGKNIDAIVTIVIRQ